MARLKEILTTGQVADICKVASRTVTKWFDSGRLKGYKIPGSRDRRIPLSELIRFMKEYGIPTDQLDLGKNRAIVITDDGEASAAFIHKLKGIYEIKTVRNGFDAGLIIPKFLPNIVFISLLSPSVDAGEICRNIRSNPELAEIQVVAVAGSFNQSEESALTQKGFDACLTMEADVSEIHHCLELARTAISVSAYTAPI
jgi:excisionase family DNA binding protein